VLAGYHGNVAEARSFADDGDPAVRATALGALARLDALDDERWARSVTDDIDSGVRRRACELAGQWAAQRAATGQTTLDPASVALRVGVLIDALADRDHVVTEAAAWALGEFGDDGAPAADPLGAIVTGHEDALCREAAVAALGAIGVPSALPVVLAALEDKPAVRRRAAIALAAFDDPSATEGLRRCMADRDWQVRQAAEDLLDP
jgi:HEAT repeat protein